MKYISLSLIIVVEILQCIRISAQWEIDERCLRRRLDDVDPASMQFGVDVQNTTESTHEDNNHLTGALRGSRLNSLAVRHLQAFPNGEIFNMRLHWQVGACWQEEWIERFWCMQCEGTRCAAGDMLWLQPCDDIPHQKFEWIERFPGSRRGRLKTAYYNLCLEKRGGNTFELHPCATNNPMQILQRSSLNNVFELYPRNETNGCINQHHHPKPNEWVMTTDCEIARRWFTNLWEIYWPSVKSEQYLDTSNIKAAIHLRDPECNPDAPCDRCIGDCDGDADCAGDLVCYQRPGEETIPGCTGIGVGGKDYCFRPESDTLWLRLPYCSPEEPCGLCQGDCESDSDCEGNLKCFQRRGNENVPGCNDDSAIDGFDYCYNEPTPQPSSVPSVAPSTTVVPTTLPTDIPSHLPSVPPSVFPTSLPTITSQPSVVPSALPSLNPTSSPTTEPSQFPSLSSLPSFTPTVLKLPLQIPSRGCSNGNPCIRCNGDCDNDSECEGNLKCFMRRGFESVPGCIDGGFQGTDYCYEPI